MKSISLIFIAIISIICSGCAVNLPFNNRLSYQAVQEAKSFSPNSKGPISINWIPQSFPERIDVQGASGFVGGGSQTRIPIGPGVMPPGNRVNQK
jgi:hypothetical protein